MDLIKALIEKLQAERDQLDKTIRTLQAEDRNLVRGPGRKSMGEEERKIVSLRMKKYWANRRKTKQ